MKKAFALTTSAPYLAQSGKRGVDFGVSSCAQDMDLQAHSAGRLLHIGHPELKIFNVGVQQHADQGGLWGPGCPSATPSHVRGRVYVWLASARGIDIA
jgi:hypothetical protein